MHAELLARTRELIAGCECEHGCPTCVGPVGNTGPLAKLVALRILDLPGASRVQRGRDRRAAVRGRGRLTPGAGFDAAQSRRRVLSLAARSAARRHSSGARGRQSRRPRCPPTRLLPIPLRRSADAWHEADGQRFVVVERKYPPGHRHGHVTVADGLPPSDGAWPALDLLARTAVPATACCSWTWKPPGWPAAPAPTRFWSAAAGSTAARSASGSILMSNSAAERALLEAVAEVARRVGHGRHLQRQDVRPAADRDALSVPPDGDAVCRPAARGHAASGPPLVAALGTRRGRQAATTSVWARSSRRAG